MTRPKLLQRMGMVCTTAPERIWLQCDPEPEHDGKPIYPPNPAQDDVTWCADKINASDTLYVRADKVLELLARKAGSHSRPPLQPVAWRFKERINGDFDTDWILTKYEPADGVRIIAKEPLYTAAGERASAGQTDAPADADGDGNTMERGDAS